MFIEDDGIRLHIELERPENAPSKLPLVIVIHGFTGHMEEPHILAAAKTFLSMGYAVIRAEMYGHGQSGGDFKDHTLFKWMTNAMTVIDYARSLPFVSDIYLCGHSQGGLTAMLAAGLKHEIIKGVIALAPAALIPEFARKGELLGLTFDPDNIPEALRSWNDKVLGNNYIRAAQMIRVEDYIDKFNGPVLIVQGTSDHPDLMKVSKEASERYKDCTYMEIEGATHCFDDYLPQMTEAVRTWMSRS
ncbi:MAG: alpha/beta fold hydrolase [Clostridiales bacterium]|nr:alpha/beta fold hydrolase [Clostridiales bacterium]